MHLNSILLFENYAKKYFKSHIKVLEIAPDNHPSQYRKIIGNNSIIWESLDITPCQECTYIANNEYEFPVPDNCFDIVLSGQVIEHVRKIWNWMKELARVCKKGGVVVTIAPTSWPFHEAPVDCWRIYPEGMKALYDETKLEMELCKCESLENRSSRRRVIPGTGIVDPAFTNKNGFKTIVKETIKDIIGWPTAVSYDTIAIGRKVNY